MEAWYFCNKRELHEGTPLEVGRAYTVEGLLKPCNRGPRWSKWALNALRYASGSIICRVRYGGDVLYDDDDNGYSSERTVLWAADVTVLLHEFARWCASQVLPLWDAPAMMREFLVTGDESIRYAARKEAWTDAPTVARVAARGDSAGAARATAAATTLTDAVSAARTTALIAARATAANTTKAGAPASEWDAAWNSAWAAQNIELERRLKSYEPVPLTDCSHDWRYVRDWYGDPNVPNGTADCSFLRCRICGEEDHESDPREYLYNPSDDE
jgi:hypothetical protein